MRKQISIEGMGFTEHEAKVDAYNSLKQKYNNNILIYGMLDCQQAYAPRKGTLCTTENIIAEGARKWVTKHVAYAKDPVNPLNLIQMAEYDGKTEAVKEVKELVLKHNCEFTIKLERHLVDSNPIEAIIKPRNAQPGKWNITLDVEVMDEDTY